MSYIYGPVPSRRLGRSLGVDPLPLKTCNFSCVYCQLGRTERYTKGRKEFFPKEDIAEEMEERVREIGRENIDYITFAGSGEPTLYSALGWLIEKAKEYGKVAMLTNGSLLSDKEVRKELRKADVVLPTLDAGYEGTFKRINRPYRISFDTMIEGMVNFRKEFRGELWFEFMAIDGLNDSQQEISKVKEILDAIGADRVYINVPIRAPAEPWVRGSRKIQEIKAALSESLEIVMPEEGEFGIVSRDKKGVRREILDIIRRHPMRRKQIEKALIMKGFEDLLEELIEEKEIEPFFYEGREYFRVRKK
ncbi:MAG: radical SAM protein [Candidatus Thermoplasmatota archaeon]|nr:radical SAM protein [Candidatus Thermoplasmatota archaeon]